MSLAGSIAPGARVVIRDEEWMVRRVDRASEADAVSVVGLSELVRNVEATFLTSLDEITVLRPEDTALVRDTSPGHRQSRLYLEALLRRSPPTDARLVVGHRAAVRPTPYQWDPAAQALGQLRPRILMADGVGLGKTIEIGVLLSELVRRGRGRRILVVALKSLLAQIQEELWARFTLPLVRLDSMGIGRVQAKIPASMNPFHHFDRVIISIDTLKKDERYRRYLEDARWDAVVIDECQNVAERGTSRSQRSRLAQLLARRTDALILTSATPHDGRPESFASLVRLLEPTAIADPSKYSRDDVGPWFIRRFQKDVRHAALGRFHERDVARIPVPASPAEESALRAIRQARFRTIGRSRTHDMLFRTLLLKAWLSSPAACRSTLDERTRKLEKELERPVSDRRHTAEDLEHDLAVLAELRAHCDAVPAAEQTKLEALCGLLEELGWRRGQPGKRVVLFSERIDTLNFLAEELSRRFELPVAAAEKKAPLALFHGGLADREQYALVQDFSNRSGTIRLLLGSDAASEGLNLHHACHHLVHFDVPWSLMTLEQRNGRIDRFGQEHAPVIRYLLSIPSDPELQGDQRIIDRLIEREEAARENLGEAAWVMNLHDPAREEARIARAIEEGEAPEAVFDDATDDEGEDWLAALLAADEEDTERWGTAETIEPPSLFPDDLAWAREGFIQLGLDGSDSQVEWVDALRAFRLRPPPDLRLRYEYLPPELARGGEIALTVDRERVMAAYARARDTDDGWPEWELFWELHPVAEWLCDRVLASFRRHEAPVVEVGAGLPPGSVAYVFQSTLSNGRSQPVIVDWSAVVRQRGRPLQRVEAVELLTACGFGGPVPNSGASLDLADIQRGVLAAVQAIRQHLDERRLAYEREAAEQLRPAVRALRVWQAESKDRLRRRLEDARGEAERRIVRRMAEIDAIYQERQEWVAEGLRASRTPYVRLAAVLARRED